MSEVPVEALPEVVEEDVGPVLPRQTMVPPPMRGDFDPYEPYDPLGSRPASRPTPDHRSQPIFDPPEPERAPTIRAQPGPAPTMRRTRIANDPDARSGSPFLCHVRVYYRVFSRHGVPPLHAKTPISNADPTLSFIQPTRHLPPPYTVQNITRVLCNREGVHPSRATLYLTAPRGATRPPARDVTVDVFSETGNYPGSRQNDPMMFVVEKNENPDDDITQPLSVGASCGRWWHTGCIGRSINIITCPCQACGTCYEIWMWRRAPVHRPGAH